MIKDQRVLYRSKNNLTGLTDVKALVIRRNGVSVASNIALTEVSAVNEPGLYELYLPAATITGYGGAGFYDFFIDSASKSSPDVAIRVVESSDSSDVEAAVNAVNAIVSDIQSKVNNGTYGLSAIKGLIDVLQATANTTQSTLGSIEGVGFVSADDSLKAISDRIYTGGRAI
jgi:hypothetical protein